jgi:O-antigen/teichoic acid export membrane protein
MRTLAFYSALFIFFMILQRGSGLLTKIVLANVITPYEYGLITLLAISLPGLFQLVTMLNLTQMLSHAEEGRQYFGFSLLVSTCLVIVISLMLFGFQDAFFAYLNIPAGHRDFFYGIIVISILLLTVTGDFQALFTGLRQYALPSFFMALPSVARLVILLPLLFMHTYSFEVILLVFAFSNAIPLGILLFGRYRSRYLPITPINIPSGRIFTFGLALFIVGSFNTFGQSIIKIVVSHDLGIVWQGYYDISLTMVTLIIFALYAMAFVSVPEATSSNRDRIYGKGGLVEVTRALFALALLTFLVLALYSGYLVKLLFTEQFLDAGTYLPIMGIGYLFLFIQTYIVNLNLSFAQTVKEYALPSAVSLVMFPLFFFLTTVLIHFFAGHGYGNGFIGAYVSYTVILVVSTLLMVILVKDLEPLKRVFHRSERLFVSFIVVALVLYVLQPHPVIGIAGAVLLFLALVFGSGYLDRGIIQEFFGHAGT